MTSILQIENLTATYNQKTVLNNLNFQIEQGQFICLCGPNGSGKSTLLSCLACVPNNSLSITHSSIKLDSQNLANLKPKEISRNIAYLQQSEFCTWDFTVKDFVLQGRYCHTTNGIYTSEDVNIARTKMEMLGILNLAEKSVHQISGGEFQKVRIARALTQEPKFLLLDEPASNLDFSYEPKLMELLKQLCFTNNIGILLSIHNLNIAARFAQKIMLLSKADTNNPQMLYGSVEEIFTKENLSKTFEQEFQIFNHPIYNKIQIC